MVDIDLLLYVAVWDLLVTSNILCVCVDLHACVCPYCNRWVVGVFFSFLSPFPMCLWGVRDFIKKGDSAQFLGLELFSVFT